MSSRIEIQEGQAARLQKIAVDKGVTPDALLAQALGMLFQQTEKERMERETIQREEQDLLKQLEAEDDNCLPLPTRQPFNMEKSVVTHAVLVDPTTLRRL